MADKLTIRCADSGSLSWILQDEASGEVRLRGSGDVESFEERFADITWSGTTRLILAGESVLLNRVAVPSKQARQIQQAVPYLIEEQVASDVDDCHFAWGDRDGDTLLIATLDNHWFAQQLTAFDDLQPAKVTSETLLVPQSEGLSILVDEDRTHLRFSDGTGMTCQRDDLDQLLALLPPPTRVDVHVPEGEDDLALVLAGLEAEDIPVERHVVETSAFEFLAARLDGEFLNLRSGTYAIKEKKTTSGNGWQTAAILAGAAFLLHVILTFGQGVYLGQRAAAFESESQALYAEVFPNDRNVRDLRRRWRSHLRAGDGETSTGFLSTFGQVAANIPGSNLVIQNVNYNENRGDLILQLSAPRSEQLVLFSQTLNGAGLDAEIGTISQEESAVRGSIKIRAPGGS